MNATGQSPLHPHDAAETEALLSRALGETLERARQSQTPPYLTGGTAVAAYTGVQRPLSLDLDFFVHPEQKEVLEATFGGSFKVFSAKPLFKSDKLVGASGPVDLDFIAQQSIVPDDNQPQQRISLALTPHLQEHSVQKNILGYDVTVIPPEYLLIAKLFAGRGIDLGKYDLKDCESLLAGVEIRHDVLEQALQNLAGGDPALLQLMQARISRALSGIPSSRAVSDIQQLSHRSLTTFYEDHSSLRGRPRHETHR